MRRRAHLNPGMTTRIIWLGQDVAFVIERREFLGQAIQVIGQHVGRELIDRHRDRIWEITQKQGQRARVIVDIKVSCR